MAELAVLNIAKSLLEQLSSPAKDEFRLWFNSKAELEKLKNTITCIKGVLHDAEQKKATNIDIGGWLSRLQDEMYKADDLFDTISTRALKKKAVSGNHFKTEMMVFFSKSNQAAFVFKTAHKVKELREQLDDIVKDISRFGLIRSTMEYDQRSQRIAVKRRVEHSFIVEHEVIGREEDKQELLRLLMEDKGVEERVSVIAVVGIGGQGKTTIAQLLYNSKEVEEFFELRLWACINYFSDLKEGLEEITSTKSHNLDVLQNRLREKISGKKFLLVIDDVWDDIREQWLCLKRLLYSGEIGSKVLMTTRSQTVAQNLATFKSHYALGELSDDDAWILFKKMAFDSNEGETDKPKEELGRQILKKCPKVPLAIRTVGSFLYGKDKKKWSTFIDNELMKAMPDSENLVMQALKISYDDLPSSLKHCFAYCSLFPKDHEVDKTTLIHLWMAQGLLEIFKENPCLEEVGEDYFLYLVQRGFFQNVKVDEYGEIINCKMHDLFHDLAVQRGANECQAMLKVTDELGRKFPRHLLVKDIKESMLQCTGLRSLVSPNTGFVERVLLDGILRKLTSLRTLSLRQLDVEEIPSSIGKLVHLRYLDLTDSKKLINLPDALCKLQNLLILRLEGCKNLIKLPGDLQKLISLRHLKIAGCGKLNHIPQGLQELTSLATLDRLIVHNDYGGLRCLKHLNNVTGDICIKLPYGGWKNCVTDAEESMLINKTKLSRLSVVWSVTKGKVFSNADIDDLAEFLDMFRDEDAQSDFTNEEEVLSDADIDDVDAFIDILRDVDVESDFTSEEEVSSDSDIDDLDAFIDTPKDMDVETDFTNDEEVLPDAVFFFGGLPDADINYPDVFIDVLRDMDIETDFTNKEEEFLEADEVLDTIEEVEFPEGDVVLYTNEEEMFFGADEEEFLEVAVVLHKLQPSSNISHLKVVRFPGVKFPNWISALHNLVELTLDNLGGLRQHRLELPQLRHLLQLKKLVLLGLLIEYVENDTYYDSVPFFPSLEYLKIAQMSKLKGWRRPVGEEVSGVYDLIFPRLSHLYISHCPCLTSLPLCPSLEDLTVYGPSADLVTQIVRSSKTVELEASSSSQEVPTCSKLNYLSLHSVDDLAFLPEDFSNLTFVNNLCIMRCSNFKRSSLFCLLQHLPYLKHLKFLSHNAAESSIDVENMGKDGMQWRSLTQLNDMQFNFGNDTLGGHLLKGLHHLTNLERLTIKMERVPNDEDMQWTVPPNLKFLWVEFMNKGSGLSSVMHQLKNLQCLVLSGCKVDEHELNMLPWEDLKGLRKLVFINNDYMRSLPENWRHLSALEDLMIRYCSEITFLPDWVSRLKSLDIFECSKLKEACRKPTGSCWPLIRDIPYISIREYS